MDWVKGIRLKVVGQSKQSRETGGREHVYIMEGKKAREDQERIAVYTRRDQERRVMSVHDKYDPNPSNEWAKKRSNF